MLEWDDDFFPENCPLICEHKQKVKLNVYHKRI